jgi:acyl-CoA oxidase
LLSDGILELSVDDILSINERFWSLFLDPIGPLDFGCCVIAGIQINLVVGTIAKHLPDRPDLAPLVQSLLDMNTIGVYLLSERGHGLDAINCETTATKCRDGFILHTPREEAMKYAKILIMLAYLH